MVPNKIGCQKFFDGTLGLQKAPNLVPFGTIWRHWSKFPKIRNFLSYLVTLVLSPNLRTHVLALKYKVHDRYARVYEIRSHRPKHLSFLWDFRFFTFSMKISADLLRDSKPNGSHPSPYSCPREQASKAVTRCGEI